MFHNPHRIIAYVPASTMLALVHENPTKSNEVEVSIPCFMDDSTKRIRTGEGEYVQQEGVVSCQVTEDQNAAIFEQGSLLRFAHKKDRYYKVFDSDSPNDLFGGTKLTVEARLVRHLTPVKKTDNRTVADGTVESVPLTKQEPTPSRMKQRWG